MLLPLLLACAAGPSPGGGAGWPVVSAFTLASFTVDMVELVPDDAAGFVVEEWEAESDLVISLSDHLDRCAETRESLLTWAEASQTLLAASDDGQDAEALCAGMPALLESLDATAARHAQQGHGLSLSLCHDCDDLEGRMNVGGEDVASATLEVDADPVARRLVDSWNPETCALDEGEAPDTLSAWRVDGVVELSVGPGGAYSGTMYAPEAEQLYGAEAEVEPFELNFSTALCEPPEVERLVYY